MLISKTILYLSLLFTHNYGNIEAELVRVYDGDTIVVNIKGEHPVFGERILVRVYGVDCPEMRDKREKVRNLAIKAKEFTQSQLANKITLVNVKRDKYFRILADIYTKDNKLLSEELIKNGFGKPYFGGKKEK